MADEKKPAPAAAPAKKDDAPADGAAKKGGNPLLVIIIIVVILGLEAGLLYFMVPRQDQNSQEFKEFKAKKAEQDSIKAAEAANDPTWVGTVMDDAPIEAIVNILGTDGSILKVSVLLEYYEDKQYPQLGDELHKRVIKFKDLFSEHMASLTLKELTEPGARDNIRKDLLRIFNANIPAKVGTIQNVIFKDFIIQY
jgi:flagellar basal body-associated protein FliL